VTDDLAGFALLMRCCKAERVPFELSWRCCLPPPAPGWDDDRAALRNALTATREAWRALLWGRPARRSERAVVKLVALIAEHDESDPAPELTATVCG
jgi:hypothetical protein